MFPFEVNFLLVDQGESRYTSPQKPLDTGTLVYQLVGSDITYVITPSIKNFRNLAPIFHHQVDSQEPIALSTLRQFCHKSPDEGSRKKPPYFFYLTASARVMKKDSLGTRKCSIFPLRELFSVDLFGPTGCT